MRRFSMKLIQKKKMRHEEMRAFAPLENECSCWICSIFFLKMNWVGPFELWTLNYFKQKADIQNACKRLTQNIKIKRKNEKNKRTKTNKG